MNKKAFNTAPVKNMNRIRLSHRISVGLTLLMVLSVVFCCYYPALENNFVRWDDHKHVYENSLIETLDASNIIEIFKSHVNHVYIPLTTLSFAIEYHFFGLNPRIYHLTNILLHLFVVLFVFLLGRRLNLSVLGSGAAALIFGIHPIHVESVAWITERKDVLYAFFYMLSMYSYTFYLEGVFAERKSRLLLLSVFIFGMLSMLAKPMALSLPLILLLIDWFKRRPMNRSALFEKIPIFLGVGAITWMTYSQHIRAPESHFLEGLLIWIWSFVFYLRQFIWPAISVPIFRLLSPIHFGQFEYVASFVGFIFLIGAFIRLRKFKWFLFSALFYVFSIFFLLRYDASVDTNIVADRFMYLPSLGFCLLIGFGMERVVHLKRRLIKLGLMILFFGCVSMAAVKTYQQCFVWRDDIALWQHQLKYFPNEPIALNGIVAALRKTDEFKAAEDDYQNISRLRQEGLDIELSEENSQNMLRVEYLIRLLKRAMTVAPDYVDIPYKLGNLYYDLGLHEKALASYQRAVDVDPTYQRIYLSLGHLYRDLGLSEKAVLAYTLFLKSPSIKESQYVDVISAYTEALGKNPFDTFYKKAQEETVEKFVQFIHAQPPNADSLYHLGALYVAGGQFEGAISTLQRALEVNPKHRDSLYGLANLYNEIGRFPEAIELYKKVIEMEPRNSDAYFYIGTVYHKQGKLDQSQEYYQKAIDVDPSHAKAHFSLGYIHEQKNKSHLAMIDYRNAVKYDPENAEAYYNLGNVYLHLKDSQNAVKAYLKAVTVNQNHVNAWINLSMIALENKDFMNALKYYDEAVLLGYEPPKTFSQVMESQRSKGR